MKKTTITINGKDVDTVVFGDGQEQIDLFNTVAAHAREKQLKIQTVDGLVSRTKGMQKQLIIGKNDKYDIGVMEEKFPGIPALFCQPRYFATVINKETFEPKICYGTIAHYFWDLLNELKAKQK